MTPELSLKIHQHAEMAKQLKQLRTDEMVLRKEILGEAFPDGKIGTNTLELGAGWKLKGVFKIDRKVDETTLQDTLTLLRERKVPADVLIRWKPEVVAKEYKKLTPEDKLIFDQTLVVKPVSPSLEIVEPKKA
jgi:hypothetical protein